MKSLNTTRNVTIKYPRDTPRISRKRLWYDRNSWREQPQEMYDAGTQQIDQQFTAARNQGELSNTPYQGLRDMMNRAGRIGIRRS